MTITLSIPYATADGLIFSPSAIAAAVELYGGRVVRRDETALLVDLPFDVEPTFVRTASGGLRLVEVSLIPSEKEGNA
jgi:hypothetical protein